MREGGERGSKKCWGDCGEGMVGEARALCSLPRDVILEENTKTPHSLLLIDVATPREKKQKVPGRKPAKNRGKKEKDMREKGSKKKMVKNRLTRKTKKK